MEEDKSALPIVFVLNLVEGDFPHPKNHEEVSDGFVPFFPITGICSICLTVLDDVVFGLFKRVREVTKYIFQQPKTRCEYDSRGPICTSLLSN